MKKFEKVEKTGIISTKFSLRCTPSVILGLALMARFHYRLLVNEWCCFKNVLLFEIATMPWSPNVHVGLTEIAHHRAYIKWLYVPIKMHVTNTARISYFLWLSLIRGPEPATKANVDCRGRGIKICTEVTEKLAWSVFSNLCNVSEQNSLRLWQTITLWC